MAIYRTDEDYAKRAALAKALREYADVVEQGAPIASSVYWADTPRDPRPLPSSLHITLEQINITFPPASFWRAAIVPYSDDRGPSPLRGKYAHVGTDDTANRLNEIKAKIAAHACDPDAFELQCDLWRMHPQEKLERFQQFAEGLAATDTSRFGAEAEEAFKSALGSWYADPRNGPFPRFSEDTAAEQQAAYSTLPPWRDRLKSSEMAQLALAEAYSHDLQTIPDETRGTHGKALRTIAALVQILDERE